MMQISLLTPFCSKQVFICCSGVPFPNDDKAEKKLYTKMNNNTQTIVTSKPIIIAAIAKPFPFNFLFLDITMREIIPRIKPIVEINGTKKIKDKINDVMARAECFSPFDFSPDFSTIL